MGVPGGRDSEAEDIEVGREEDLTEALRLLKKAEEGETYLVSRDGAEQIE